MTDPPPLQSPAPNRAATYAKTRAQPLKNSQQTTEIGIGKALEEGLEEGSHGADSLPGMGRKR
ncbi:MAG: hypothetical protein KJO08_02175 [Gammaproteobacteria bacterium]|nr:hypothetical protein [Gammaproteobacteria bacterium]